MIPTSMLERLRRLTVGLALAAVLAGCAQTVRTAAPPANAPAAGQTAADPFGRAPATPRPARPADDPFADAATVPTGAALGAPPPSAAERAAARRAGARLHPRIMARYGGAVRDARLAAYVSGIGGRLVRAADLRAADRWVFTVLDTGEVNAFASPGGYVYITRGLLALANDEGDVAAVIGHELGHIERRHAERRLELMRRVGEIGEEARAQARNDGLDPLSVEREFRQLSRLLIARFSQEQEFEADADGIRIAALAGYDPGGQGRMLRRLRAQADVEARAVGAERASRRMRFLATHPATPERLRRAARVSARLGPVRAAGRSPTVQRAAHLDAINGLVVGDESREGFVRGRDFIHPELRFRFRAPPGFRLANSSSAVIARAPDGRLIVFDGRRKTELGVDRYLRSVWYPALRRQFPGPGPLGPVRQIPNADFRAVTAAFPIRTQRGPGRVQVVAFDGGDTIYRLTALTDAGAGGRASADLLEMARSFRRLRPDERNLASPDRIRVVSVRPGDTVASLAARLPFAALRQERFRVLNDLRPGERLRPGQRVKLVVRDR